MVVANRNTAPQHQLFMAVQSFSSLHQTLYFYNYLKTILHFYKRCYGLNVPKQGYLQIIIFYMTALHFILKGNNGDP